MEEIVIASIFDADGPGRAFAVLEPQLEGDDEIAVGLFAEQSDLFPPDLELFVSRLGNDLPRRRRVPLRQVVEEIGDARRCDYGIELDRDRARPGRERLSLRPGLKAEQF